MMPDGRRTDPDSQFLRKVATNHPPEAEKRGIEQSTPSFGHPSVGGEFLKFIASRNPEGMEW